MRRAFQVFGVLLLIGAAVATAMGYWRDAGIPLAFMGVFWFFFAGARSGR